MGALTNKMERDSRRYFERRLLEQERDLKERAANLRSLRSDLGEDVFYDATDDTRARIGEALSHLATAVGAIEEAREQLP